MLIVELETSCGFSIIKIIIKEWGSFELLSVTQNEREINMGEKKLYLSRPMKRRETQTRHDDLWWHDGPALIWHLTRWQTGDYFIDMTEFENHRQGYMRATRSCRQPGVHCLLDSVARASRQAPPPSYRKQFSSPSPTVFQTHVFIIKVSIRN